MIKPKFTTFTGVDDFTDLDRLVEISDKYPVEWGILSGFYNKQRCPNEETIQKVLSKGLKLAYHLCEKSAEQFQEGTFAIPDEFSRIQVNGKPDLEKLVKLNVKQEMIIQVDKFSKVDVSQLYDVSAGRGLVPESFPEHPGYMVGFAGGINPENVEEYLKNINCDADYWIDMESGVRTDNKLDLNKVEAVLQKVYGY